MEENLEEVKKESSNPITDLSYSPDGRFIAGVGGRRITIWERLSGKRIKTFLSKDNLISVSYSPDGKEIAVGDSYGRILVYNHSGRLLKEMMNG